MIVYSQSILPECEHIQLKFWTPCTISVMSISSAGTMYSCTPCPFSSLRLSYLDIVPLTQISILPGLSVCGRCLAPNCEWYTRTVWVHLGFGTFNINRVSAFASSICRTSLGVL